MKKTINLNISGVIFNVEEDAYDVLDNYLTAVKKHFFTYANHEEILADIENRIAEQLLEQCGPSKIVSDVAVKKVITSMGQPEDFDSNEKTGNPNVESDSTGSSKKDQAGANDQSNSSPKRLMRNPDDAIVAGVASGLGAYFGIDPILFRFIFGISVFLGGSGIIIYILLWIIMPEAKTPTDKLKMRGNPINLNSLEESIKEKGSGLKENSKQAGENARGFIITIIRGIGKIIKVLVVAIAKIFGGLLIGLSAATILGLTAVLAITIFNAHSPYIQYPIAQAVHGTLYYALTIAGYIAIVIPVIFIFMVAVAITRLRRNTGSNNIVRPRAGLTLLAIWFAAIIAVTVLAIQAAPYWQNYTQTQEETQTYNFGAGGFDQIAVGGTAAVHIIQGDHYAVTATGSAEALKTLTVDVNGKTLQINRDWKSDFKLCIFCFGRDQTTVDVTVPDIKNINAAGASRVIADTIITSDLTVVLSGASQLDADSLQTKSFELTLSGASRAIITSGTISNATLRFSGASYIDAPAMSISAADAQLSGASRAIISVSNSLQAELSGASYLEYSGQPQTTFKIRGASRVYRVNSNQPSQSQLENPNSGGGKYLSAPNAPQ